jgi:ribosomal protein S18 acetylase RimI-like enzyme
VSLAVEPLDLGDDALLARLVALQRASYAVEARLIGAESLPPMRETPEQLRASGETFLGARDGGARGAGARDDGAAGAAHAGRLVGALSYRRDGDLVDIHRLVVDPAAFRRGVATALLDALEQRERDARRWTVGTGAGNVPALTLYERRGYRIAGERQVAPGVRWVRLERMI